jgi:MFS family permease
MSAEASRDGRRAGPSRQPGPLPLGRRFRFLWFTFALASSGDGFAYGAVPLLAVVVDHRALAVSAVVASDSLPWLLAALPAGTFSDRFERGRLMAVVNIARGVLLTAMAIVLGFGRMNLPLLIMFVLANGTARTVYYSASQAAMPEFVDPNALERANGLLTGTEAAGEHLAGPILGAAAFVAKRVLPFAADAAAVGLSGVALLGLRTQRPDVAAPRGSIWDGARLLYRDRQLRVLVTLIASLSGLQGLVAGVLVLVATKDWGVTDRLYGVFLAAGAVGNVPGALLANRIVSRIGNAATLLMAAIVSGVAYVVMAISHTWVIAGAAFVVVGFAVAAGSVVAVSLRQRLTANEVMGRVGSAWRGIVWGAAPVGALAAGGLAILGTVRLPIYLAGSAQCIVAAVLARPLFARLGNAGQPVGPAAGPDDDPSPPSPAAPPQPPL